MDLSRNDIAGMEALVRWGHPVRAVVAPLEFIPLAEDTGLIVPLGRHILMEACRKLALMQRECPRHPLLWIAVNVSGHQLQSPQFVDDVRAALGQSGIPPSSLILELTESVMMQDMDLTIARLKALRASGVRLAIDDFGTGYSSLNYIRQFPVDILKIDRSFLADPTPQVAELTAAIVDLARIFKLQAVAEGIENQGHVEFVRSISCEFGQGFHFARPLAADEMLAMTAAQPRAGASNGRAPEVGVLASAGPLAGVRGPRRPCRCAAAADRHRDGGRGSAGHRLRPGSQERSAASASSWDPKAQRHRIVALALFGGCGRLDACLVDGRVGRAAKVPGALGWLVLSTRSSSNAETAGPRSKH